MQSFWLWFVLLIKHAQGDRSCKDLDYLKCFKDQALIGHVIKSFKIRAPGLQDCQGKCFREKDCVSYNLSPVNGVIRRCELNDFDHWTVPGMVVISHKPGYEYCPIQNPCSSKPCNGKLCKPTLSWDSFICMNGLWSTWSAWSICPCPQKRSRTCQTPVTGQPASDCPGQILETRPCPAGLQAFSIVGCAAPLVASLPDQSITASSVYPHYNCYTKNARLHSTASYSSWCARVNQPGEYLQIDLGAIKNVTKIATEGRNDQDQWVTKYSLSYSNDTVSWIQYNGTIKSCVKIFNGNTDRRTVVTNDLPVPIKARHVRVISQGHYSHTSMKLELYGC